MYHYLLKEIEKIDNEFDLEKMKTKILAEILACLESLNSKKIIYK